MYVIDEIEGSNVANLIRSFITKKTLENVNILKKNSMLKENICVIKYRLRQPRDFGPKYYWCFVIPN